MAVILHYKGSEASKRRRIAGVSGENQKFRHHPETGQIDSTRRQKLSGLPEVPHRTLL